jgi:hypothetical protein
MHAEGVRHRGKINYLQPAAANAMPIMLRPKLMAPYCATRRSLALEIINDWMKVGGTLS